MAVAVMGRKKKIDTVKRTHRMGLLVLKMLELYGRDRGMDVTTALNHVCFEYLSTLGYKHKAEAEMEEDAALERSRKFGCLQAKADFEYLNEYDLRQIEKIWVTRQELIDNARHSPVEASSSAICEFDRFDDFFSEKKEELDDDELAEFLDEWLNKIVEFLDKRDGLVV